MSERLKDYGTSEGDFPDCRGIEQIAVRSSLDGSVQPALFHCPAKQTLVPLVVGLHTWSYDRFNQVENYLPLCRVWGWALLLPEARGPNLAANPHCGDACGSRLARQDILDAVRVVCHDRPIDRRSIFLLGCSGGGHLALLAAEEAPELFRAVDAWCPVSDLRKWHRHLLATGQHYYKDMEKCLGGGPEEEPEEYALRSPATRPERLRSLPVSIHHGRHDTVVPYRHSLEFAQAVEAAGNDRIYLDIFDGEHEQFPARSFEWFAKLAGVRRTAVEITG